MGPDPGRTEKEVRAAATLISMRSKGDLKAMEAALLAFPPGDAVRKDLMLFYLEHAAAAAQGEGLLSMRHCLRS